MALKIAVIGAGNIGGALIGGILKSEVAQPADVIAIDASDECRRRIAERWKVPVSPPGDPASIRGRDVVILAVKPQIIMTVLQEYRSVLQRGMIILSVAAGVPISFIESVLGKGVPIFRAMPNIPQMGTVWTPVGNELTLFLQGKTTAQKAMDAAAAAIKKAHG